MESYYKAVSDATKVAYTIKVRGSRIYHSFLMTSPPLSSVNLSASAVSL